MNKGLNIDKWGLLFLLSVLSIISGLVISLTSQLGEKFHTSIIDQINAGNPPILTFIGMGLMILPPITMYLLVRRKVNRGENEKST